MENDGKAFGHLPDGWVQYNLEKIATKITKGATPTTYGFTFLNDGIKFIKVENIRNNSIDIKGIKHFISEEAHGYQKRSILEENDILFSIAGTIGNTCIIKKEYLPANTNQALAIIGGYLDLVVPKLLKLQLASFITDSTKAKARGGAMNNISLGDLKNLEILIPPLPEQHQIVAKIEELFSELDNGIENLKKAREQLKTYRQAVLKYAFEGKLTKEWRGLQTRAGNPPEPAEKELEELPEGWKWKQIKEITTVLGDGLHGTPIYSDEGDYYFINGNNLSDGKIEIKENTKRVTIEEYEKYKKPLSENTVLVSINGTLGNTAFYNGEKIILGKSACYFNTLNTISKHYIRYCITSQRFINYAHKNATGSTIKNVSLNTTTPVIMVYVG